MVNSERRKAVPKLSIIIGPPMSGKTTYAQSLLTRGVVHISVGKICRDEAEKDTHLGRLLKKSIQENIFLDSKIFLPLILDRKMEDHNIEFILDGYPKYKHEVEPLIQYARNNSITLFRLYCLHVELNELLKRLNERHTCNACYMPIRGKVQCICGGAPFKREEDTEAYFLERYARYRDHVEAILNQLPAYFTEVIHV